MPEITGTMENKPHLLQRTDDLVTSCEKHYHSILLEAVLCFSLSFPLPEMEGNMSVSWLYDALADRWSKWLPKHTASTLKRWLLLDIADPAEELLWLVEQLHESESQGEKVHIIGHIPPGSGDCLQVWSENYNKIIVRFQDTVRGQFFGHTHMDELKLFYDDDDKQAVGVAYLAPSVTTYRSGHPAFRVYTIDGNYSNSTWTVLDHETHIANLTEANDIPDDEPVWELEYRAKSAYGMPSLQPQEWDSVLVKMRDDDELFNRFYGYYSHQNPLEESCGQAPAWNPLSHPFAHPSALSTTEPAADPAAESA
ncbi:hypothetical protein HPB47_022010 [Ixodes persulcatus]|uniref:Uncharacterized protein n=1 Tax=Ixodes persulcatus TaxID=34615 RepID=A0AC60QDG4_IXOPE|nr:hypothetical protein HPB47_022010 [Ixodes persulcatus]